MGFYFLVGTIVVYGVRGRRVGLRECSLFFILRRGWGNELSMWEIFGLVIYIGRLKGVRKRRGFGIIFVILFYWSGVNCVSV